MSSEVKGICHSTRPFLAYFCPLSSVEWAGNKKGQQKQQRVLAGWRQQQWHWRGSSRHKRVAEAKQQGAEASGTPRDKRRETTVPDHWKTSKEPTLQSQGAQTPKTEDSDSPDLSHSTITTGPRIQHLRPRQELAWTVPSSVPCCCGSLPHTAAGSWADD